MDNTYSPAWYTTFADTIAADQTDRETAFLVDHLPVTSHPRLLDLCCGTGRHALRLAREGYQTVGADTSDHALRQAAARAPETHVVRCDMRQLPFASRAFDGVLNLWQSFGYHDDATNRLVLRQIHDRLRPGGRAIFDIYNRDLFERLPLDEVRMAHGTEIRSRRRWHGHRYRVELEYDGRAGDVFEWRLYSPEEFQGLCDSAGFRTVARCARFDDETPVTCDEARMQFVLERSQ